MKQIKNRAFAPIFALSTFILLNATPAMGMDEFIGGAASFGAQGLWTGVKWGTSYLFKKNPALTIAGACYALPNVPLSNRFPAAAAINKAKQAVSIAAGVFGAGKMLYDSWAAVQGKYGEVLARLDANQAAAEQRHAALQAQNHELQARIIQGQEDAAGFNETARITAERAAQERAGLQAGQLRIEDRVSQVVDGQARIEGGQERLAIGFAQAAAVLHGLNDGQHRLEAGQAQILENQAQAPAQIARALIQAFQQPQQQLPGDTQKRLQ